MNSPTTYQEWLLCFDKIREGTQDQQILEIMRNGKITLEGGVGARFAEQLSQLVQFRIQKSADNFSKSLGRGRMDQHVLHQAMLRMRKEYKFLIDLSSVPAIPKEYSEIVISGITKNAEALQSTLEESSKKEDRSGTLTMLVKQNPVSNLK